MMTQDEKNEAAAVRWVGDGPRVTATDHRDFHTALAHVVNLVTALTNLRAAHERALTTERTRREAAEARLTAAEYAAQERDQAEVTAELLALRERAEKAEAALMEWRGTAVANAQALVDANARLYTAEDRTAAVERRYSVLVAERDARTDSALARLAATEQERDALRAAADLATLLYRETERERDESLAEAAAWRAKARDKGESAREAVASRDAALAALASVVDAARRHQYATASTGDATTALLRALDVAASPAALGAKVIARAEERGAKLGIEAAAATVNTYRDGKPVAALSEPKPTRQGMEEMARMAERSALYSAVCRITALDPAEVCKAARGAR